jgi:glycosidase
MLAEWHEPELLVKAFDVDYSWPLHHAMSDVLMGTEPATHVRAAWEEEHAKWPRGALAASALMFTLDGVPLIYNGMEVGDTTESGAPALFERLPIFWKIAERRPEFPRFYKQIIELRRQSLALRRGAVEWLRNSDEARVVSYLRREGAEEIVVAINFSNRPFEGTLEAPGGAGFADVTPDVAPPLPPDAPAPVHKPRARAGTLPALTLDAWGYRIFRRTGK